MGAFALRLFLFLSSEGYAGVDMGAYILGLNQLLGTDTSGLIGPGLPRPPLAPGLLLWPFLLLGPDIGAKLFISVASMSVVVAATLLASRLIPRFAWVVALGVSFDWWLAELMIAGALPLIGFAILLVIMWGVMTNQTRKGQLTIALGIPLLAHTSMTATGIALVALPAFTVAWWWFCRDHYIRDGVFIRELENLAIPVIIGVVLALSALPWYIHQVPGGDSVAYSGGPIWYFAPIFDTVWWQSLLMVPVLLYVLSRRVAHPGVKALIIAGLAILPLAVSWSYDEALMNVMYRSRYFIAVIFWIAAAFGIKQMWGIMAATRLTRWTTGALWSGLAAGYVAVFLVSYPAVLTIGPDSLDAVEYIQDNPNGTFTNAGAISFWLAGMTGEYSVYAQHSEPPALFTTDYAALTCVMGWRGECDPVIEADEIGVGYVYIDFRINGNASRLPPIYGAPAEPFDRLDALPWLSQVYSKGEVALWRIAPRNPSSGIPTVYETHPITSW